MNGLSVLAIAVLALSGCAVAGQSTAPGAVTGTPSEIVARYYDAMSHLCVTGVTSEVVALYRAVDRIWDAEPSGGGRGSNFGGARDPELAWRACFQSPGWD